MTALIDLPDNTYRALRPEDLRRNRGSRPGEIYGDMVINPHFHNLVAGGGVILFKRHRTAAPRYHDPYCQWYKIMRNAHLNNKGLPKLNYWYLVAMFINFLYAKLSPLMQHRQNIFAYVVMSFMLATTYFYGLDQASQVSEQKAFVAQAQAEVKDLKTVVAMRDVVLEQQNKLLTQSGQNLQEMADRLSAMEKEVKQQQVAQMQLMQNLTMSLMGTDSQERARIKRIIKQAKNSPQG